MIKLPQPLVIFDADAHTYHHATTGQSLSGITSTLLKYIKPDKYKGIPQATLEKAAQRGHAIHAEVELFHSLGAQPTSPEAQAWAELYEKEELQYLESEYLITDHLQFASAIDLVFQATESSVHLADVKTTSVFDKELVAWQLSIYAYFFEQQCPEIKVEQLLGIHLRGDKARIIHLPRHSNEEVQALIEAYNSGKPYEQKENTHTEISQLIDTLTAAQAELNEWQAVVDSCKAKLLDYMNKEKLQTLDTAPCKITRMEAQQRTSFDSRRFKEEQGELYSQYLKTTQTTPTLRITFK